MDKYRCIRHIKDTFTAGEVITAEEYQKLSSTDMQHFRWVDPNPPLVSVPIENKHDRFLDEMRANGIDPETEQGQALLLIGVLSGMSADTDEDGIEHDPNCPNHPEHFSHNVNPRCN